MTDGIGDIAHYFADVAFNFGGDSFHAGGDAHRLGDIAQAAGGDTEGVDGISQGRDAMPGHEAVVPRAGQGNGHGLAGNFPFVRAHREYPDEN
jgi:hypothetical protein